MSMRKFPTDNFIIYYMIEKNTLTVTIIRIVYKCRDIKNILNTDNK